MNTDVRLTVYMRSQASAGALQSERAEVSAPAGDGRLTLEQQTQKTRQSVAVRGGNKRRRSDWRVGFDCHQCRAALQHPALMAPKSGSGAARTLVRAGGRVGIG